MIVTLLVLGVACNALALWCSSKSAQGAVAFWARLSLMSFGGALAAAIVGCAPMQPPLPAPAVDVYTRGSPVCTGVRIAPTVLATARHCTEHGWALSVDGTPAPKIASLRQDVAYLRVPAGPHTPPTLYDGERYVRVASFAGVRIARVEKVGLVTGLELEGECVRGESGAPVTTARGVVAVITHGRAGRPCYAQWVVSQ